MEASNLGQEMTTTLKNCAKNPDLEVNLFDGIRVEAAVEKVILVYEKNPIYKPETCQLNAHYGNAIFNNCFLFTLPI